MKYEISNSGCDDKTKDIFEFTEEQFQFLNNVFTELNKKSTYGCMPKIYIDEVTDHPTEKGGVADTNVGNIHEKGGVQE